MSNKKLKELAAYLKDPATGKALKEIEKIVGNDNPAVTDLTMKLAKTFDGGLRPGVEGADNWLKGRGLPSNSDDRPAWWQENHDRVVQDVNARTSDTEEHINYRMGKKKD